VLFYSDLSENQLTSTIPAEIGNLINLQSLFVSFYFPLLDFLYLHCFLTLTLYSQRYLGGNNFCPIIDYSAFASDNDYQGDDCTSCEINPCENGGNCIGGFQTPFTCECPNDYTGPTCSESLDTEPSPDCPAERIDNTTFSSSPAGSVSIGSCDPGFSGSPSRTCDSSGTWEAPTEVCQRNQCPEEIAGNANWISTPSFETQEGVCVEGYEGTPLRICRESGDWGQIDGTCYFTGDQVILREFYSGLRNTGELFWNTEDNFCVQMGVTCLNGRVEQL